MTATDPRDIETRRRRPLPMFTLVIAALFFTAVGIAVPLGIGAFGQRSGATASDVERVGVNRLGAATLDIEVAREGVANESAAFRSLGAVPGDTVTGELRVVNDGSLPLRYAMTVESDPNPLADWLTFDVWTGVDGCDGGIGEAGTVIRRNLMLASTVVDIVGDPATGRQPGDRALAPGEDELLCVAVTLALSTPNEMQGRGVVFDIAIAAEHDLDVDVDLDLDLDLEATP